MMRSKTVRYCVKIVSKNDSALIDGDIDDSEVCKIEFIIAGCNEPIVHTLEKN